jgi:hypothetical protein
MPFAMNADVSMRGNLVTTFFVPTACPTAVPPAQDQPVTTVVSPANSFAAEKPSVNVKWNQKYEALAFHRADFLHCSPPGRASRAD